MAVRGRSRGSAIRSARSAVPGRIVTMISRSRSAQRIGTAALTLRGAASSSSAMKPSRAIEASREAEHQVGELDRSTVVAYANRDHRGHLLILAKMQPRTARRLLLH